VWEHSLLIHLPIFAMGAVLASLGQRASVMLWPRWAWDVAATISAATLLILFSTPLVDALQFRGGRYGYPVVPGLLAVILYAATRRGVVQQVLSIRPLVLLGLLSYGIYLLHLPILRGTLRAASEMGIKDLSTIALAFSSFGLTCLVASVISLLVEAPIRRFAIGLSSKK
jgi:peptidoglycan/LPS O-acetylase OafA/YrhL